MDDQAAKLFAGHMGICAVLVNVLIDKGIISRHEIRDRFEQAHEAACQCSGGPMVSRVLAEVVEYLEAEDERQSGAIASRPGLDGAIVLLVEEQPIVARDLQTALEEAGADVLLACGDEEALLRVEQFDLSAAVLCWLPGRERTAVTRLLKDQGVRFLFYAAEPPEDVRTARGGPILVKPTNPAEIVRALQLLIGPNRRSAEIGMRRG